MVMEINDKLTKYSIKCKDVITLGDLNQNNIIKEDLHGNTINDNGYINFMAMRGKTNGVCVTPILMTNKNADNYRNSRNMLLMIYKDNIFEGKVYKHFSKRNMIEHHTAGNSSGFSGYLSPRNKRLFFFPFSFPLYCENIALIGNPYTRNIKIEDDKIITLVLCRNTPESYAGDFTDICNEEINDDLDYIKDITKYYGVEAGELALRPIGSDVSKKILFDGGKKKEELYSTNYSNYVQGVM